MGIIKTETFKDENGAEKRKDTYKNGMVVIQRANSFKPAEPTPDPVMEKLDSIEAKIQTNEDLQTFYDDIVKEVGL